MDLLQVAVTAVGAFVALFLLSKLMGHRQISELSVFDYVNGITIGSIAAEMATELEKPLRPLAAMVVWALLVWLLEALTSKCPRLRKYISGSPSIVFDNGKLYRRNMKKARLDLSEFLIQCRQQGFFDLGAIQTAVYEPDGRLTILPVAARRPATPEDMGIARKGADLHRARHGRPRSRREPAPHGRGRDVAAQAAAPAGVPQRARGVPRRGRCQQAGGCLPGQHLTEPEKRAMIASNY